MTKSNLHELYKIEIYENIETGEHQITPQDDFFDDEYTDEGYEVALDIAEDMQTQLKEHGYTNIIIKNF